MQLLSELKAGILTLTRQYTAIAHRAHRPSKNDTPEFLPGHLPCGVPVVCSRKTKSKQPSIQPLTSRSRSGQKAPSVSTHWPNFSALDRPYSSTQVFLPIRSPSLPSKAPNLEIVDYETATRASRRPRDFRQPFRRSCKTGSFRYLSTAIQSHSTSAPSNSMRRMSPARRGPSSWHIRLAIHFISQRQRHFVANTTCGPLKTTVTRLDAGMTTDSLAHLATCRRKASIHRIISPRGRAGP
jgi:hypothetical protein